ncbi:hypothetical protein HDE_00787 [Halotydeus destructor]|nr:hypothetical protein HDE_00787 [Halotydeus destructor]
MMIIEFFLALILFNTTNCSIKNSSIYEKCNENAYKNCYSYLPDHDCVKAKDCKMLITKEIISMDKETNELFKGHRRTPVDPDFVRFYIYLEHFNPFPNIFNGYSLQLPMVDKTITWKLTCMYDHRGEIVAKPCSRAPECPMVVVTELSYGCKFLVPTNMANESSTTKVDKGEEVEVMRIHQNSAEDHDNAGFTIVAEDYLTSDCEYSTKPKRMFCSSADVLNNQVLLKVYRDEVNHRMRFYVHYRGAKTKPGLIALITPDKTSGLLMCFAPEANEAEMVHLKTFNTSQALLGGVSTGNDMHHEDDDGHFVRQAIEINYQNLLRKTGIDLINGKTVYTYKAYMSDLKTVCNSKITIESLEAMKRKRELVLAGNVTGPVEWDGGRRLPDQSGPKKGDEKANSKSLLVIALTVLVAIFVLIAIALAIYFIWCSKPKQNYQYLTMHSDVHTVNSNEQKSTEIELMFQNSQKSDSKKTMGTTAF